jgi:hypothetical protein
MTELTKTLSSLQSRLATERAQAIRSLASLLPDEPDSDEALLRVAHLHTALLAVSSELEAHQPKLGRGSPD